MENIVGIRQAKAGVTDKWIIDPRTHGFDEAEGSIPVNGERSL